MTLSIDAITTALGDHAATLGVFETVSGHEVKNPPTSGVSAEIFIANFELVPGRSGLAVASTKLLYTVRLRTSFNTKPADAADSNLMRAVDALMTAYCGDFDLEGLITAVDLLGAAGTAISGRSGYIDQAGKLDRIVEITLPLIVDDVWTEAA